MDGDVKGKDDDILKEARERFKLSSDAEDENRLEALDDLRFLAGEQWPDNAKEMRKGRPCLTINRLPQYIRQVVNEQRKTRPAIDVIPGDSLASKPTADVLQGLIRYIERSSRAKIAYDTAFKGAVACGFGHFRITTEYCDEDGFEQEIRIDRIANPFTVYRDPSSQMPDHSDDVFTFVTEMVEPEAFERQYGFRPSSLEDAGTGDEVVSWFDGKRVRVAEYWRKVTEDAEIHQLSDGTKISGEMDEARKAQLAMLGVQVLKSRKTQLTKVEQYLLTYDKVIKKSEWLGKYIPIVTVIGDELNIEGKTRIESLTRFAKDPARMYNYWASAETELVALQPKAPWIGPAGSFDGYEAQWAKANVDSQAYLEYNPVPGQPGPQRQFFAGVPGGVREGRMAAAEDIKAVTGLYDASLGNRSNETSGVAIRAREEQGDNATFHFIDNLSTAMEFAGRVIIDLAPRVYDTARVVRIITPTNEEQQAVINQTFIDPATGQAVTHDFSVGKYSVSVRTGPSFESKRQEMVQSVVEMAQANPMLMEIAGDLVMRNMDWPQSEEIAERIQQRMEQAKNPPQNPEKELMQQQMQLEGQKAEAMLKKVEAETQAKMADAQIQGRLAQINANTAAQKSQAELAIKQADLEIKRIDLAIKQQEAAIKGVEAQARMNEAQMVQVPM